MLTFTGAPHLCRVVVLNPKGGSGKSTLAFNIAGYLAATGRRVALVDMDEQGSSLRWLHNRPGDLRPIVGIRGSDFPPDTNGDRDLRIPEDIDCAVVDAPARLGGRDLIDYTCGAHAILVPVLPSDLDIHAASRLVSDLLLVAQLSRRNRRLGIVANRVNERTIAFGNLMRFLNRLSIAVIGTLRHSQNYVNAAAEGRCIHEMLASRVEKDLDQWRSVTRWLEQRLAQPISPRDLLRPETEEDAPIAHSVSWYGPALIPAAAALVLAAITGWFWHSAPGEVDAPSPEKVLTPAGPPAPVADLPADAATLDAEAEQPDAAAGEADAAASLRDRWQLSGIVHKGEASVLLLSDRKENKTRHVNVGGEFDGWTVKNTGTDYAVLTQNGEDVRLVLSEDRATEMR